MEAWEKVFVGDETFMETMHGRYGCIACHGGVAGAEVLAQEAMLCRVQAARPLALRLRLGRARSLMPGGLPEGGAARAAGAVLLPASPVVPSHAREAGQLLLAAADLRAAVRTARMLDA